MSDDEAVTCISDDMDPEELIDRYESLSGMAESILTGLLPQISCCPLQGLYVVELVRARLLREVTLASKPEELARAQRVMQRIPERIEALYAVKDAIDQSRILGQVSGGDA